MEEAAIGDTPYPFKGEGNNKIEKPKFEGGKVWVNKTNYFEDVPEVAWGFPIGGYQPAQKWLKDRKGEYLRYEDVTHYQKIIKILMAETDRIITIEMVADISGVSTNTSSGKESPWICRGNKRVPFPDVRKVLDTG